MNSVRQVDYSFKIAVPATLIGADITSLSGTDYIYYLYVTWRMIFKPKYGAGLYEIDYCNDWSAGNLRMESALIMVLPGTLSYDGVGTRYIMRRLRSSAYGSQLNLDLEDGGGDVGNSSNSKSYGFIIGSVRTESNYYFRIRYTALAS